MIYFGSVEEHRPQFGRQLADSWQTVGRQLTESWAVGIHLAYNLRRGYTKYLISSSLAQILKQALVPNQTATMVYKGSSDIIWTT